VSGLGKSIDFTLAEVSSEKGLWITTSITLRETCYKIADVYFGHSTHDNNHWMDGSADLPFFLFPRFCGVCVTLQNRLCIAACSSLIPSAHERHDHGPCPSACPCPDQHIASSGYFEAQIA